MRINNALIKKRSFIFLILVICFFILHSLGILRPVENSIIVVLSPLQKTAFASIAFINKIEFFKKFNLDLVNKNIELENNYKKLLAENLALKGQIDELRSASDQILFHSQKNYSFEMASVIGKDIISDSTFLVVNKGSAQGIKVGQPITAEEGIIIGKIIEVQDSLSKAILLIDTNSKTAATFMDNNKTLGIINGDHGLGMKMELIPQDETVLNNDIVITSGTEEHIPYGLIIGSVTKVNKEANNFFQTAYVQPLISYNTVKVVTIIKTY